MPKGDPTMNLSVLKKITLPVLLMQYDNCPVLSKEKEYQLAVLLKEHGEVKAAEQLIHANLKYVVKIAMGYTGFGLPMEDIIQEGTIGLMIGVKKFNPYKGYRLITYASWWIKAIINQYILHFRSIVKSGTSALQKKLFYAQNRILNDLEGRSLSEQSHLLSVKLHADSEKIEEIISWFSHADLSLNNNISNHSEISYLDCLDANDNPEETVIDTIFSNNLRTSIESAISKLSSREQDIVRRRFMTDDPVTLEVLGKEYGISRERVRQIEGRCIIKLKTDLAA
jgi:RNA polymerase sigma-32 factor